MNKGGRPTKDYLLYYSVDVSFINDPRLIEVEEIILNEGGSELEVLIIEKIIHRIWTYVYSKGYYAYCPENIFFKLGEGLRKYNIDSKAIKRIFNALMHVGIVDKYMYNEFQIITSVEIQVKWLKATRNLKRVGSIHPLYSLVSSEETGVSSEETGVSSEETGVSSEETQLLPGFSGRQEERNIYLSTTSTTKAQNVFLSNDDAPINSPPYSAPPPHNEYEYEIYEPFPSEMLRPAHLGKLYFALPRLHETRISVAKSAGIPKGDDQLKVLQEWGEVFVDWLIGGRGNESKTFDDFINHFYLWIIGKDIDAANQTPQEFREKKLKNKKQKDEYGKQQPGFGTSKHGTATSTGSQKQDRTIGGIDTNSFTEFRSRARNRGV